MCWKTAYVHTPGAKHAKTRDLCQVRETCNQCACQPRENMRPVPSEGKMQPVLINRCQAPENTVQPVASAGKHTTGKKQEKKPMQMLPSDDCRSVILHQFSS